MTEAVEISFFPGVEDDLVVVVEDTVLLKADYLAPESSKSLTVLEKVNLRWSLLTIGVCFAIGGICPVTEGGVSGK